MSEEKTSIKRTAVERSMADLDRILEDGVEMSALGRHEESIEHFKRVLTGLEERFRGGLRNIPVDVLIRRFRTLAAMGKTLMALGRLNDSEAAYNEAMVLAQDPLKEFPEFFVQISLCIADVKMRAGDINSAKTLISAASKIQVKENFSYCKAMTAECTSRLFLAFGKPDMAEQAVKSGLSALSEPEGREQLELLGKLKVIQGDIAAASGDKSSASIFYDSALTVCIDAALDAAEDSNTIDAVYFLAIARAYFEKAEQTEETVLRNVDVCSKLGEFLDIRGHWDLARAMYIEASELIKKHEIKSPLRNVLCLTGLANMDMRDKNYKKAVEEATKAVEAGKAQGNELPLGIAYFQLGLIVSRQGDVEKSLTIFKKALDTVKEVQDSYEARKLKAKVYNQLGYIESKKLNTETAFEYYRKTVELMLENYPYDMELGEAFRLMGEIYAFRQQGMQGDRALKKALEIFEKNCASVQLANVNKSLGSNFLNMGDLDKANFFLDESIAILEKLGVDQDLPILYSSKGKICIMRQKFEEAEELFKKDFEIAKKTNNDYSLAYSHYHLGIARRHLNRVHSAEDSLRRSRALFETVKDNNMLAYVLMEMAICASSRKDIKTATDCCAKALEIFGAVRLSPDLAKLHSVRGVVMREAGRTHMAQRCFEDSLRNYDKLEIVNADLAETHYEFAQFWRTTNNRGKATDHMNIAIDLAEKLGLAEKLHSYMKVLTDFNPEEAAKLRLASIMDKSALEKMTKAKTGGENLTVERKNLTLLFTDIRSFTTISETLSMEELTSFLNDFYRTVTRVIMEFQGRVNKFIGDEILAIFNLDGVHEEDHPLWAVRAAMEIVRAMDEVNEFREKKGEHRIGVGVGLNSGEVLLGSFGSGLRQDYTAIGDNVNIAARLQSKAKSGEVMISPSVYECVKELVTVDDMGKMPLKGKEQPMQVWKVTGLKD